MDIRILGPLEVRDDNGRSLELGSPKQRAVLALLALHPGRVVAADRIAFELWGDEAPRTAGNTIQAYVSRLRAALGADVITTRAPGYTLDVEPDAVDAWRFERLVQEARDELDDGDASAAAERSREALALWRGRAFADIDGVPACEQEAARLEDVRVQALEDRIDADLALGRHTDVAGELPRVIALHPFRERLYAQRMLALYRCDRQADALSVFSEAEQFLAEELGLDPGPDLKRLHEAILRQEPHLVWSAPPPEPSLPPPPVRSVPEPLTTFVGRQRELDDVRELLSASRLFTLTGAGGSGKTRLAIESVRDREFVWFVPLAEIVDDSAVAQQVATVLGIEAAPEPVGAIAEGLATYDGILVLDNCEHVVEATAELAHRLLSLCGSLRVLATSRETLRVSGEVVYRVPPLPVPAPDDPAPLQAPAAALFVDRAAAASPSFDPDVHAADVADVVRKLDGIPLAIELAAARADVLVPREIAARLDDTLGLLTAGGRTDDPHHQTLRATLRWTHDRLSDPEREVFRRLGVFVGGFTLVDAQAVCGRDILDDLTRLVALSLVESVDQHESKRFRMLEATRQFAAELLTESGEAAEIKGRHLDHFHGVVARARPLLDGEEQVSVADRLEVESGNIGAALSYAIDEASVPSIGLRMATSLAPFWQLRGHTAEGRRWLTSAFEGAADDVGPDERIGVLIALGSMCYYQGDLKAATEYNEQALATAEVAGDEPAAARALAAIATVAVNMGDVARARDAYERAAVIGRSLADPDVLMRTLLGLCTITTQHLDYAAAREYGEEALAISRELGNADSEMIALTRLASVQKGIGDLERGRQHDEDALVIARRLNHVVGIAVILSGLGDVAFRERDYVGAREYFIEALEVATKLGHDGLVSGVLANLAEIAMEMGDVDHARDLFQEGRTLAERIGAQNEANLARRGLSDVYRAKGDFRRSARLLRGAMESFDEDGQTERLVVCLESAAALAMACGDRSYAARFLGAFRRVQRLEAPDEPPSSDAYEALFAGLEPEEVELREAIDDALRWLATVAAGRVRSTVGVQTS